MSSVLIIDDEAAIRQGQDVRIPALVLELRTVEVRAELGDDLGSDDN